MCKDSIHDLLAQLPKCEHHMHIEGSLTPELLFTLAKRNNITLPSDDSAFATAASLNERYNHFSSLDDFLHYYYIGMSVLIHQSDFEALALEYFRHAHADGVMHAEVFFDPQAHLARGISYETVLDGFTAARHRAQAEMGITSELICCFLKHLPVPESIEAFRSEAIQASLKSGAVAAIGLDSSEGPFPPELFKEIYQEAKASGFKRTAHAGEEGPAAFIETALDVLHVQRVDHGVRLVEDAALLRRIADQGTLLTVCPLSNVWLKVVKHVSEVPIRKFLDAGVAFSINSDDPAYFGNNYILDNYCAVQEAFNLTVAEWEGICRASIGGSWCSQQRKDEMLAKLDEVLAAWEKK